MLSGSTSPSVGLSMRLAMPVLAPMLVMSKMAVPVVSEPVPAVVGTAMRGRTGPGTGLPLPAREGKAREDAKVEEKLRTSRRTRSCPSGPNLTSVTSMISEF